MIMHFLAATSPLPVTFELIERFPAKHKSYPKKSLSTDYFISNHVSFKHTDRKFARLLLPFSEIA